MWCIVLVGQQWKAGVSYWILIPSQNISGSWGEWGGGGGVETSPIAAETQEEAKSAARGQPMTTRNGSSFPPFSFSASACPWLRQAQCSTVGVLWRESLLAGLRQTQVASTAARPRVPCLSKAPCGLGHLTALSAQAGRDNGIFHRLPVCSHRKLLMPHFQLVSGGKRANSPSKHLISVLFAHSDRSLNGWQFSSGNGSTVFPIARGLWRTLVPFCFPGHHSSALVWVQREQLHWKLELWGAWPAFLV